MKKRKRYSPEKQAQKTSEAALRGLCVVCHKSDPDHPFLVSVKHKRLHRHNQYTAHALRHFRHFWTTYNLAICEDFEGKTYIKTPQAIDAKERYLFSELADLLDAQHHDLISECNPQQFKAWAWIATPYHSDLDECLMLELAELVENENLAIKKRQEIKHGSKSTV